MLPKACGKNEPPGAEKKVGPPLSEAALMSPGWESLYNHSFMFKRQNPIMNVAFSMMYFPNLRRQSSQKKISAF